MKADDFKISNASVKNLIITDAPFNYEGSMRLAFPELVCFYAENGNAQRFLNIPPLWDLMLLSDELREVVICASTVQGGSNLYNISLEEILPSVLKAARFYPDLKKYIFSRIASHAAEDCALGFTVKLGAKY